MSQEESIKLVEASGLKHIAFIMDGNGRWANQRHLPREVGHYNGAKNFETVVKYCREIGIKYCTVYAFSTENWKRPKREVDAIMKLLDTYLKRADEEDNVQYRFLGDKSALNPEIADLCREIERKSEGRPYTLNIALNYGGRDEIVHAVNELIKEGKTEITEADISSHLYTMEAPDPDLIVRTGNEKRISNFLMWQSAYSELVFSDRLWPDYSKEDVDEAVIEFSKRKRRFGGLDKKKEGENNA